VDIGVLEEDYTSGWASPTFAIAKENGTIRVVSDFRKLNSLLKHHPFPIPKIGDVIRSMEGFTFATALDLSMANSYYHIKLDVDAQIFALLYFLGESTSISAYPWGSKLQHSLMFFKMSCLSSSKIWNMLRPILMIY
jgi:hypothetical protein